MKLLLLLLGVIVFKDIRSRAHKIIKVSDDNIFASEGIQSGKSQDVSHCCISEKYPLLICH